MKKLLSILLFFICLGMSSASFEMSVDVVRERYEPSETVGAYITFQNGLIDKGTLRYFLKDVNGNVFGAREMTNYIPRDTIGEVKIPDNALPGKWEFVATFSSEEQDITISDGFYVDRENVRKSINLVFLVVAVILILLLSFLAYRLLKRR